MATSGVTSFELTRNEIIASALRKIGAIAKGQTPDAEDYTNGTQALNSLVMLFSAKGMPLWKRTELPVTMVAAQQSYTLANANKIAQLVIRSTSSSTQYELIEKSLYDFNQLPNGDESPGLPVHYTFQPAIQDGTLRLWPTPDASAVSGYTLIAVIQEEFDSFVNSTDTPDFPPYWTDALIYGLAVRLAPEYGVPLQDRMDLIKQAEEYMKIALDYGDDIGSLFVQPDRMWDGI